MTPLVSHTFEEHVGEVRMRVDAPSRAELFAEAGYLIDASARHHVASEEDEAHGT